MADARDQDFDLDLLKDAVMGVGAIVLPDRQGHTGPCSCCLIDPAGPNAPENRMCTTKGAIGTLSDQEERGLCAPETTTLVENGRCQRALSIREAAESCRAENPRNDEAFFSCFLPAFRA